MLLIVVDTVRADRLSCYGYPRETTPNIDALAARGIRFSNVSSTSSWTIPAHASLFTGLPPILHGATQENTRLRDEPDTLASILARNGFATFAASANPLVSERTGLARGFEKFVGTRESPRNWPLNRHANIYSFTKFLFELPTEQPFFAFVNFIEAHGPYAPPEPYRSKFLRPGAVPDSIAKLNIHGILPYYLHPESIDSEEFDILSDLYDGEVAYVDGLLGQLLAALEKSGRFEETMVIVTSDHGENFGDHGHFRHVFNLYASTVRVPLIIRLPGDVRAGEVSDCAASLADVFPTILNALGFSSPEAPGRVRDLLSHDGNRPVYSEYYYPKQVLGRLTSHQRAQFHEQLLPYLRRMRSVEYDGLRFVWSSNGAHQLFDIERDPEETNDLYGDPTYTEQTNELQLLLDAYVEAGGGPKPLPGDATHESDEPGAFGELDEETENRLRELGYIR